MLLNRLFSALASRSGFEAAIFDTVAHSSSVFRNSVSADHIVVAASRLLGAAAACVILLFFAAENRKSYWSGRIQAAIVICQQIFSTLVLVIFLLKIRLFSALASRSGFEAAIFDTVAHSSIVFCNSVSADHIVVAASRLLGAASRAMFIGLICFVKCHDGQPGFQRDKLSSLSCQCGPKSCQRPRRPSVAQRKKQLSSLDCVNLLDRKQLRHVYTCRCDLMQCINAWH